MDQFAAFNSMYLRKQNKWRIDLQCIQGASRHPFTGLARLMKSCARKSVNVQMLEIALSSRMKYLGICTSISLNNIEFEL